MITGIVKGCGELQPLYYRYGPYALYRATCLRRYPVMVYGDIRYNIYVLRGIVLQPACQPASPAAIIAARSICIVHDAGIIDYYLSR